MTSTARLSHPSAHRTWAEIDLGAIADNVRWFRSLAGPNRLVMPAVKADAYGHGAVMTARACLAGGADRLAVATCREGEALRDAGIGVPIQILGAMLPEEVRSAVRLGLTISLHEVEIARLAAIEAAGLGKIIPIQVKIDSGMGRLGILPEDAVPAAREIAACPGLRLEGVFTHFADVSDTDYCRFQLERFQTACGALEEAGVSGFFRHAASSAAAVLFPEARLDMLRPGAGIYGYLSPASLRADTPLRPAMAWRSAVIQLKDYPQGSNLGYNRSFTTRRPTRIAMLPVGYADGYRREFSNRADALIRGRRVPVVGMVSMDYTMVDVTDLAPEELAPGTVATLLGADSGEVISPEELAGRGGTIPYCVTTAVGWRVERRYVNAAAIGLADKEDAP